MSIRRLLLSEGEYIVYLYGDQDLAAGYYYDHGGINQPIYGRCEQADALVLSKQEAIDTVTEFSAKGYACRAIPTIVDTQTY
jgi:hypothetical protein